MIPRLVPTVPAKSDRRDAHDQRDARTIDEPTEHVAAHVVGAQNIFPTAPILPDRRPVAVAQVAHLRVVRGEEVGGEGCEDQGGQDQQREDRHPLQHRGRFLPPR